MMIFLQKAVIRFLLGLYVLAVFQPFSPYLEYAFNKKFIVQQLCENRAKPELKCEGMCYVAKRLAKAEAPQTTQHNPAPFKHNFEQDTFYLRQTELTTLASPSLSLRLDLANEPHPSSQFAEDIFHPPRIGCILL
ncbi:hypothetical protein HUU05_04095 [candidate division KSB1 bacterium]|nr:hypothetical protein [candidate division KSB1 bacterium]